MMTHLKCQTLYKENEMNDFNVNGLTEEGLREQKRFAKRKRKQLRKNLKKYGTVGALWIDDKTKDEEVISEEGILEKMHLLFKEKDRHLGNKHYFDLVLMLNVVSKKNEIKELKKQIDALERRLPVYS